jgi:hypothetical protein
MGITFGGGYYDSGAVAQIIAMPNDSICHTFVDWRDKNDNVISTSRQANVVILSDTMFIANFRKTPFYLNVTSNSAQVGEILGNTSGLYNCNDSITLIAHTKDPHYVFVAWTSGSDTVSKDSILNFVITRDISLMANFDTKDAISENKIIQANVKPNPTTDGIYLTLNLKNSGNVKITLTDLSGNEILLLEDGFKDVGEFTKQFSLKTLPVGAYYLRIQQGTETLIEKIIRN